MKGGRPGGGERKVNNESGEWKCSEKVEQTSRPSNKLTWIWDARSNCVYNIRFFYGDLFVHQRDTFLCQFFLDWCHNAKFFREKMKE